MHIFKIRKNIILRVINEYTKKNKKHIVLNREAGGFVNNEIDKEIDIVKKIKGSESIDADKVLKDKSLMDKVKELDKRYGKEIKKIEEMKKDMSTEEKAELIMKLKQSMNKDQKTKFNQIIESLDSYVKKNK